MDAATGEPLIQKKADPKNEMPTDGFKIDIEHDTSVNK